MKNLKNIRFVFFILICFGTCQPLQAQLLKKLKNKLEKKTVQKTNKEVNDILEGKKSNANNKNQNTKTEQKTHNKNEGAISKTATQNVDKHNTVVLDDSDVLIFKSPSSAFKDIIVQEINDLPREGLQNMYMSSYNKVDTSREAKAKRQKINKLFYDKLIKIHFMKDYFKVIDKTALTRPQVEHPPNKEYAMSNIAQGLLFNFISHMLTEEAKLKHFKIKPHPSGRDVPLRGWGYGGYQNTSFTENESYVSFVHDYLNIILKWSNTIFEKTKGNMYGVNSLAISEYDFDVNGYWIDLIRILRPRSSSSYFVEHLPQTDYGRNLKNLDNPRPKILLKIDAEIAEKKLSEKKSKTLFFVVKLKTVFKEISTNGNPYYDTPAYTYHYKSPIIEVYTNEGLNDKVGEIDLENLTFKKP